MASVFNTFEKNIYFILYYVYVHISPCGYVHASAGAMKAGGIVLESELKVVMTHPTWETNSDSLSEQ